MARILIIDDEEPIRFSLRGILEDEGYEVLEAATAEEGIEVADAERPDLVFLDIWLPGMDGLTAQARLKGNHPDLPVVMISGHGTIETAVSAIQQGAYDFIEKPLSLEKVVIVAARALEAGSLRRENQVLRTVLPEQDELIGQSPVMLKFQELLARVAPTDVWVLLTGENGTGKELAARALHAGSRRADAPMIAVNCAAIPEELIESELFGHEKGAFTSADQARAGRFEMANNGTLFLDEIGDMSLKTQAKILRILQEQSFERVGGTRTIKVDVRVIAATNKNLEEAIAAGTFREDLYYRLRVVPLHLPPLRERGGDLDLLLAAFTERLCRVHKAPVYAPETMERLRRYPWPGNVRELRNFAERMVILFGGKTVLPVDLPPEMTPQGKPEPSAEAASAACEPAFLPQSAVLGPDLDFKKARAVFEARYLEAKLHECGGNITRLAETIGLERSYLHRKLKGYGISSE
jgi:two-component system nitrogen regulation response regulator NtrX